MYNLVVQERAEERHQKIEAYKAKVLPLSKDPRPEAKALLLEMQLGVLFYKGTYINNAISISILPHCLPS